MKREIFKTENKTIKLNGKKIDVQVTIATAFDECLTLDDLIDQKGLPEMAKQLEKDLNSGQADALIVEVLAQALGETGSDVLGGVIVYNREDVENAVEYNSMIDQALDDLKTNIESKYQSLKEVME